MFEISPSLTKKFIYKGNDVEHCPARVYGTYIKPTLDIKETESMLDGQFFESLCIGRTRDGVVVDDLPRKQNKTKDKTVDQIRIEQQALVFKQKVKKYMMVIEDFNTQTELRMKLSDDFVFVGHPDIFPTPVMTKDGLKVACIDLKLTKDIDNTFGDFCWGDPDRMDNTQGLGYQYLIKNLTLKDNEHLSELLTPQLLSMCNNSLVTFRYWVFGYGNKSMRDKFVPVEYNKLAEIEIKERIRKTMTLVGQYETYGWNTNPKHALCHDCPLKDVCNDYDDFNN
jgi:hypothetical protein